MIPRFRTRLLQIPTADDVIPNRVGPLATTKLALNEIIIFERFSKT